MAARGGTPERPALFFDAPQDFRDWLEEHHETATELWMGLNKKHVAGRGLTWEQAVPEALCYGWIDSVAQRVDDDSTRQRWTPRKATSTWSRVNLELVEQLSAAGRIRPMGLAAHARRRPDRQGIYAYEQGGGSPFRPRMPYCWLPIRQPRPSGRPRSRATDRSASAGSRRGSRRPRTTGGWLSSLRTARQDG